MANYSSAIEKYVILEIKERGEEDVLNNGKLENKS